jgi:hypothetical protein
MKLLTIPVGEAARCQRRNDEEMSATSGKNFRGTLKDDPDAANLDSLDDRLTTTGERRRWIFPDFYDRTTSKSFGEF